MRGPHDKVTIMLWVNRGKITQVVHSSEGRKVVLAPGVGVDDREIPEIGVYDWARHVGSLVKFVSTSINKHVGVVRTFAMGDVIMSFVALRWLAQQHPNHHYTYYTTRGHLRMLAGANQSQFRIRNCVALDHDKNDLIVNLEGVAERDHTGKPHFCNYHRVLLFLRAMGVKLK